MYFNVKLCTLYTSGQKKIKATIRSIANSVSSIMHAKAPVTQVAEAKKPRLDKHLS